MPPKNLKLGFLDPNGFSYDKAELSCGWFCFLYFFTKWQHLEANRTIMKTMISFSETLLIIWNCSKKENEAGLPHPEHCPNDAKKIERNMDTCAWFQHISNNTELNRSGDIQHAVNDYIKVCSFSIALHSAKYEDYKKGHFQNPKH